ncbi:hypothetical protein FIE12Z_7360 [Fusarium flagelliforme]|uniref:Uncharacterized protein n=2 Tax=Fusarium flagelliforme TaxID=2675880 RepID=A0A395MKU0_9HYPO|nr:hypothetical protein FIE12Z_7360 [Fusarium flagelliforme]
MLGPPTGAAILWDLVEVLYLIIHTDSDGIQPNACIIIDLILFLALTAMSSVIAFTAAKLRDSGWYFAFFQNEQGVEYLRIATGFGFMTAVVHLVMIVVAWREVKRQPPSGRNGPQIIYIERVQYPPAASSEIDPPPAYSKASQPDESLKP